MKINILYFYLFYFFKHLIYYFWYYKATGYLFLTDFYVLFIYLRHNFCHMLKVIHPSFLYPSFTCGKCSFFGFTEISMDFLGIQMYQIFHYNFWTLRNAGKGVHHPKIIKISARIFLSWFHGKPLNINSTCHFILL